MAIGFIGIIISFIFSLFATVISVASWYKSRAVYDIEKFKLPKNVGDSKTDDDLEQERALKERLKTGKWQILHIYERNNNELMVIIGKIKKDLISDKIVRIFNLDNYKGRNKN